MAGGRQRQAGQGDASGTAGAAAAPPPLVQERM